MLITKRHGLRAMVRLPGLEQAKKGFALFFVLLGRGKVAIKLGSWGERLT